MNLLLLLSALLSALTGVGQTARGLREPEPVCTSIGIARQAAAITVRVGARPVQGLPLLTQAPRLILAAFRLVAAEPPFARRRRE